jgi:DNA helicase HerA-like ATPase
MAKTPTSSTMDLDAIITALGGPPGRFGVLAESNTTQLTVIARNADVAVGDLFLLPDRRGQQDGGHGERVYVFRATQYANVLNRQLEMNDVARNKLTMPDAYLAEDLLEETLLELTGLILGYAERDAAGEWIFHRPRRLPEHLCAVYRVDPKHAGTPQVINALMGKQLGQRSSTGRLYVGDLLAGEHPLVGVPVYLPLHALSHHIGVFGRTGVGKSNLMMVLLQSIIEHNADVDAKRLQAAPASILAIDPHDEFNHWHQASKGADGIAGIMAALAAKGQGRLAEPFYYLSAKDLPDTGPERRLRLSWADITPDDVVSIIDFSEQQVMFANAVYDMKGEKWISYLLYTGAQQVVEDIQGDQGVVFMEGTAAAVQRRLAFLGDGRSRVFQPFTHKTGGTYTSQLPEIIAALEQGRVIIVDTTLMGELEQFLLNTCIARVLFHLRRTVRATSNPKDLPQRLRQVLGNNEDAGRVGMRQFAKSVVDMLEQGRLPYCDGDRVVSPTDLPVINLVIEEAPSVLNPERIKFGSVFRDICRQGRKFGIGLTVVSQQVSAIDNGILTQINTELTMALGNEQERREAIRNASGDMSGFERELQILGRGQVMVSASSQDIPLPIQTPLYKGPN